MKKFIKWLGNLSIFIYVALMFLGNIAMVMVVTEWSMGFAPIVVYNGVVVLTYILGMFSRFIK